MKNRCYSLRNVLAIAFLCVAMLWTASASAEDKFPSKQLTYVVTFDPGGQSDREARRQQKYLHQILGQQIVVDYVVGGGGAVGWKELTRTKPDGYTFYTINTPHIILQPMQQNVGYKTEQIVPVAMFQSTPLGLAVNADSPFKTIDDLLAAAKKDPGGVTIGGSAAFSGHHMATLRLEKLAGLNFSYVPFTGSAPQMTAILGNHVDAVFANSDDLVRFKDKLRVLAFSTEQRFPHFPDAPTLKEKGFDMVDSIDRGVGVPVNTPAQAIATLEKAFLEIANNPEIQKEMRDQGFVPLSMGHEASVAYIKKVTAEYTELAKSIKK